MEEKSDPFESTKHFTSKMKEELILWPPSTEKVPKAELQEKYIHPLGIHNTEPTLQDGIAGVWGELMNEDIDYRNELSEETPRVATEFYYRK
ncbi:hypothetical protein Y1Q_0011041 [Alligator mississippiensis]|uniref:Uncharacterized protein n=1 Tax=Alligator mississippiensis TaxID=8496 RepID=A0A151NWM7_ALLMI|nr:hypothetical protein Y1Q_0011041 [Alligator mississippiensis]